MEGAINLVATSKAGIHNVRLERITLSQQPGKLGTGLQYDLRPTNADIAPSPMPPAAPMPGRRMLRAGSSEWRIIPAECLRSTLPA